MRTEANIITFSLNLILRKDCGNNNGFQSTLKIWTGIALFILVNLFPATVFGQAAASSNYDTQTGTLGTTYSWIDCSSGTTIITGDDAQGSFSWPFTFSFYDNTYTTSNSLSVATNGFIRLDGTANTSYAAASSFTLSSGSTELGQIIATSVNDNFVGRVGTSWVKYLVSGSAPNRILTIEYNDIEIAYNDVKYADVQVSFYETLNKVVLKFGADNVTQTGVDMGIHSGVSGYFDKWQEVESGTNNAWVEYTPTSIPTPPTGPAASWNYNTQTGTTGTTYSWISCAAGSNIVTGDDAQATISWPFNFNFYDNSYTTANNIGISTNGFIRFDGNTGTNYSAASAYTLSGTSTELGQIVALGVFDGKVGDNGGWIRSLLTGTAPYRIFTIEYNNLEINYNAAKYADIQVSFYETLNKIVLKFGTDNVTQSGADMGIHSGVSSFFNKWQEVASGTNNTWIEYSPPYIEVNATTGTSLAFYPTLKAAFDKVNDGTHRGNITIKIKNSTTEPAAAVLNASGAGSANYASVKIYPTVTGISINGDLSSTLIDLNGADNVTIDGRVNATGSIADMVIVNTSTAANSTLRFINDATNNTIKYCNIKGSETQAAGGVVFFSTTSGSTGNDANTIDNNNITSSTDANRPINAVYSLGTTGKDNSENVISNNRIYDFLNRANASNGIYLNTGTTGCTILGNSFYETTTFASSAAVAYNAMLISNTSGNNFDISGNYIGGKTALCGGAAWTKTNSANNAFTAINLSVGITTSSSVQNNTIQNMIWSNSGSSSWIGINVLAGNVNIGTATGNTIGNSVGTASIVVTNGANGNTLNGIRVAGTGNVDIQKNVVAGMKTAASSATNGFHLLAIEKTNVAGDITISNNTIGSTTISNSLLAESASSGNFQYVYGIRSQGTGTSTISNNTISNITNSVTSTNNGSRTVGIETGFGSNSIVNNVISNISTASAQTGANINAAAAGISQLSNTAGTTQTIVKNKVSTIKNTHPTARTDIYGIFMQCPTSGTHEILQNFVQGFTLSSSNTGSIFDGIMLYSGAVTCANNVISAGTSSLGYVINGIWDNGGAGNNANIYFNTVYIGGSVSSGSSSNTTGLYSFANTSTRDYRNNILVNARTGGTANSNYSVYLAGTTGLTINYNDYVFPAGSILGKTGATNRVDLAAWKTGTGQDANSLNTSPGFASAGGTNAEDYIPSTLLLGVNSTGITIDYNDVTRLSTPQMGAFVSAGVHVWTGATSTDFATPSNWAAGVVPSDGEDLVFAASPARNCVLDKARIIHSINNGQGTYQFILNGKTLTLTGNMTLTNGAKVDASATGSVLIMGGSVAQTLPVGAFVGNTLAGLTLNNASGLSLLESLTISEALILTSGSLTIGANTFTINGSVTQTAGSLTGGSSSNIIIGGSGAGTSLPSVTLNNLTLNRSNGISLGGNVSVGGTLALTAGTLTIGANTLTIAGNTPTVTSGNINAGNASASLIFTNISSITLPASVFSGAINNLSINGGGIIAKNDISVNGILNLQSANQSATKGSLDMNSYTLNMGVSATTTGIGDVTGTIKRQHVFSGNIPYSFGNEYTTLTFINTGTKPGWVSCKVSLGTATGWRSTAVKRVYSFAKDAGDDRVNIRLHYLDSELDPTETDESKLVLWDAHNGPTWDPVEPHGKSNNDATGNWVELTGMSIGYLAPSAALDFKQWGLSFSTNTSIVWTGFENNGDWSSAGNWNGGVPTSADVVLIPAGLSTTYPTNNSLSVSVPAVAKTIEIEAGASVTVDSYDITISGSSGAWINNGTFNAGTGKVIFNRGVLSSIVTVAGTTNFYNIEVAPNTTMQPVAGCILRIAGAGTADATSLVDFSTVNNTVEWNGTNQTIVNPVGIGGNSGYYNLILSGSGTKTMPATAMGIADQFIISGTATVTAASVLTVGGELEIYDGATFASGNFDHFVGGHFDNAGTFIPSIGSTITLNGTAVQNIYGTTPTSFEKLTINNVAGVDIFTDVTVNNTLTLSNGNLNVGSTLLTINGDITKTSGFINVSPLSSLSFGGTTALSPAATLFYNPPVINNLTINRTGGVIACCDFTVNGILNLQSVNPSSIIGTLDMGTYTLSMGATATTIGDGDVTGKIRRTTILPNIEYTFGNKFSSVTFPNIGTLPTQITLKVSIGTAPTWKTDGINRVYDISQIGGSGTRALLKSHYLDSELNGNNENNLSFFGYIFPTSTLLDRGLTELNTTENWITLSNADFGNLPPAFGVIEHGFGVSSSEVITWDGTESTDWFDPYNWTPAFAPSVTKVVIIPDAATTPNDPLISANSTSTVKTLDIQFGGILNAGDNSELIVNGAGGAWSNTGTFNSGTGNVIFDHGVLSEIVTVSGSTDFYNIEVGPNTTMQPVANNVLRIAGAGIADVTSIIDFSNVNNTVEWNGADQTIVVPNGVGGNSGYYNLILSGSGTKTMPAGDMIVRGDFSTSGSIYATAVSSFTVLGNITVGNGTAITTGAYNHYLSGNFQNNGTFNASTGGNMIFNGSSAQTISGTSTTSFDNFTINNISGVAMAANINVNNALTFNNGTLKIENYTLGINGTINNSSGNIEVSTSSNLIFGGTAALVINNNLFSTEPSINNLTINRAGGVTLGNQSITINGTLSLTAGTFTIGSNTLTLAGNSPTRVSGNIDAGNTNATLAFTNASAITLPVSLITGNLNNLTVNGAGVNAGSDLTLNGVLNLMSANQSATVGSLDMGAFTLNMGVAATTTGTGDVTGIVKREHTFTNGIEYSFGNQYTNLNFLGVTGSTKPTWVSCKISIGSAPTWRNEAINRYYSFAQSGGNDRMIVKLHYLDSELHGIETDETQLVFWDAYNPDLVTPNNFTTLYPRNHSGTNTTDNWIQLTGPAINYLATSSILDVKQWGLSYSNVSVHKWIGLGSVSYPGDWSLPGHWEGGVPSEGDEVLIPSTLPAGNSGYPYRNLLPVISPANAKSIEIESGAILNSNGYNITVSGSGIAWVNNGTFTAGSGTVIFNHGDLDEVVTIHGSTSFNNLTVDSKTFLQAASLSTTKIAGIFYAESDSKLDFTSNINTVEYNGSAAQSIVNQPAESTSGYYHLVLSGNGTKTLTSDELKIYGNLTSNAAISATGNTLTLIGSAAQSISGTISPALINLTVSNTSGTVTSSLDLTCSGNFTNSGEFDMTSAVLAVSGTITNTGTVKTASVNASPLPSGKIWGGTVQYYNSAGNQTAVGGTFNNLTFSNTNGTQTAAGNLTVNGTLTTTSGGFLDMTTNQLLGTLSTINNGGTIQTQNTSATPIPANKTWGGTIQYNALAGGQTVMAGNYGVLTLGNTGGTQSANGDISAATFNTTTGGTINMGTNVLSVTNVSHTGILKTQNTTAIPFTAGITWGGTIVFDATSGQTLPASTFNNLTITNTAGVTSADNQIVNGIINLSVSNPDATHGSLDMSTYTLNLGANATTTGVGDVTGIITRTSFSVNKIYTYGNQNQYVLFPNTPGQTLPSSFSLKVTLLSVAPSWVPNSTKRLFEIAQTGGANTRATFRVNYLDSELAVGIDESVLSFWQDVFPFGGANILERGWSDYDINENWITFSDANFGLIPGSLGYFMVTIAPTQFVSVTWDGSDGTTDWNNTANWTPAVIPTSSIGIIIPKISSSNNFSPDLPVDAEGQYLIIQDGGILNTALNAELTLSGNGNVWSTESGGVFNPGNSMVTFNGDITGGVAVISGNTDFYNITIDANTTLRPGVDSYIGIANFIINNGVLDAAPTHNTIEFKKDGDYAISNPNGDTPGYHTLILSGTGTKTLPASLDIWHDFINNGTVDAGTGLVKINGNYSLQNIGGTSITNFYDLAIENTSGTITTSANITASNSLTVDAGAILQPGSTTTVGGSGTLTGSGTVKVTGLSAINSFCTQYPDITKDLTNLTVDYNGAGNQTICAENYGNLVISPNGTRTVTLAGSGIIGVAGFFDPDKTLTDYVVTGSTMNSNGTGSQTVPAFNYYNVLVSGVRDGSVITLVNGGTIGIAGHSTVSATNCGYELTNNTIDINGSGDQNIDPFTFWNVRFSGGGTKTTSGDLTVVGSFTVESGVTLNMDASVLSSPFGGSITNNGTIQTACLTAASSSPLPSGKTWGGTIEYTGSGTQTLVAGTYNNLSMIGSGGGTTAADIAVNGVLNLDHANPTDFQGILHTGSNILNMGVSATTLGIGDVTGIVKREHAFLNGVGYSFGNQFTTINFLGIEGSTKPTSVSCKIEIGTAPEWRTSNVKRIYSFLQADGNDRTYVKLHYLDSELDASETDESKIIMYTDKDGLTTGNNTVSIGKTSNDLTDNWVELLGMAINQIATSSTTFAKEYGLGYTNVSKITWTGEGAVLYPGDWSLPGNWLGGVPTATDDVVIPAGLSTAYPFRNLLSAITPANVKTLEIEDGAAVTATDFNITVSGDANAWINNGTFNAGTGTVIFNNGNTSNAATISGTTNFYNLSVSNNTKIQTTSGSITGIGGTLSIGAGSILDFSSNTNTIIFNGNNSQDIPSPNGGATPGYYNLSLSSSGTKTFPASTLKILGDLTINADVITNGNTLEMLGSAFQTISGSNTTEFNNLTIDNSNGVSLDMDQLTKILGTLQINAGKKLEIAANNKLTVTGNIVNNGGNGGLTLISNSTGSASLLHNTDGVSATVERYIGGAAESWHFLSSPVSNQTIAGSPWLPSGTYGNGTGYDLYAWDEPTPCWVYQLNTTVVPNWPTVHPSGNFVPGRGYLYSVQAVNTTKSFTGNLNNGNVAYELTADGSTDVNLQGFNLVGNPYPSSIDWMESKGWTRDNLVTSGGGNDMWIWNPAAENYGVYNSADATGVGTNAVTRYIPPMQGFFVRAEIAGDLETTNDVRVHDATTVWKSGQIDPSRFIAVVHSETDNTFDEVRLLFGYPENKVGAAKLFSPVETAPSLYLPDGKSNFTVRYLTDTIANPHVPLMFKAGRDGYYTINFDFNTNDFDVAILEDRQTGGFTDLILEPDFRFKASVKDNENRFIIHFGAISTNANMELPANIYTNGGQLVIDLTFVDEQTEVKVVDVLGRTVLQKDMNGNGIYKLDVNVRSQIIIVYAKTNTAMISRKVFVR